MVSHDMFLQSKSLQSIYLSTLPVSLRSAYRRSVVSQARAEKMRMLPTAVRYPRNTFAFLYSPAFFSKRRRVLIHLLHFLAPL
jgi:hypothetical protein